MPLMRLRYTLPQLYAADTMILDAFSLLFSIFFLLLFDDFLFLRAFLLHAAVAFAPRGSAYYMAHKHCCRLDHY